MKVQSLAVIFAIIILPMIIILSYYIHREVDTIALQTAYDTKLIDATHDAMASFELNTANEDLSSVSDALRSIIEASNNTFFNTLATNLGMSNANKSYVQSYVPAILYTLYDGYYIYSPTRVPEVKIKKDASGVETGEIEYTNEGKMQYRKTDGTYTTNLEEDNVYYKQDYILKSYMPYSARYKDETKNYDLTINYTLDNYMSVIGYIGDAYYSKTGYLIKDNLVSEAEAIGLADDSNLMNYNEIDAEEKCLSGQYDLKLKINPVAEDGTVTEITYTYSPVVDAETGEKLSYKQQKERLNKLYENIEEYYNDYRTTKDPELINLIKSTNIECQDIEYRLENLSAIAYYVKAQIFSNWVYENLGDTGIKITEANLQDEFIRQDLEDNFKSDVFSDLPAFYHDFDTSSTKSIFDKTQDPENKESDFSLHKYNVIKNSIQYNLNLALSAYDRMAGEMDIKMPVLDDNDWDKILNNIAIVSFMQGFNCGLKYYNNYAIVSSTNNEITVLPNEIYYVRKDEYNTGDLYDVNIPEGTTPDTPTYHRIDCGKLDNTEELISFRSKEVKYDKIYNKNSGRYEYDHKSFACYNCIVNSNYEKDIINEDGSIGKGYSTNIAISALSTEKKKAYYRAIGKAKENIYKTNALPDSNGYQILYDSGSGKSVVWGNIPETSVTSLMVGSSSKALKELRELEITFKDVNLDNIYYPTVDFEVIINGVTLTEHVVLNIQETPQTITLPVHINETNKINYIWLRRITPDDSGTLKLLNIKAIYE